MFKTKILVLGPCGLEYLNLLNLMVALKMTCWSGVNSNLKFSGKSTIANYLADAAEISGDNYRPTQGVRIVEFESNGLELNGRNIDAEVELWDCSGDKKFEKCWPAIQKDTNGVILVCNPDNSAHLKELEQWYTIFVGRRGISSSHVIIFLHQKPDSKADVENIRLTTTLSGIQCIITNIEQDGEALRLEFNNFLCNVIAGLTDRREADESNIAPAVSFDL